MKAIRAGAATSLFVASACSAVVSFDDLRFDGLACRDGTDCAAGQSCVDGSCIDAGSGGTGSGGDVGGAGTGGVVAPADFQPVALGVEDLNDPGGVLDPDTGGQVVIVPRWLNASDVEWQDVVAQATLDVDENFGTAVLPSSTCSYGPSFPSGAEQKCNYEIVVERGDYGHWDLKMSETLAAGSSHTWVIHVGGSFEDVVNADDPIGYDAIETLFHIGATASAGGNTFNPPGTISLGGASVFAAGVLAHWTGDDAIPTSGTVDAGPYECILNGQSQIMGVDPDASFCRHAHYLVAAGVAFQSSLFTGATTRGMVAHLAADVTRIVRGLREVPETIPNRPNGLSYDCTPGEAHYGAFPDIYTAKVCASAHFLHALGIDDVACAACDPATCQSGDFCEAQPARRRDVAVWLVQGAEILPYVP